MRGVLVGVDDPYADPDASPHGDGRVDHARDAERLVRAPAGLATTVMRALVPGNVVWGRPGSPSR
jgi:hypothetical protein